MESRKTHSLNTGLQPSAIAKLRKAVSTRPRLASLITPAKAAHLFSAKGAAFISSLGHRPRIRGTPGASAENAIHFRRQFDHYSHHAPVAQ